jgi:glycerol-3-phosphate acyltransferase PlsY
LKNSIKKIFKPVSKKQTVEFALVAILISLFLSLYFKTNTGVKVAFVITVIAILVPVLFYPFAVIWFGLSNILGAISSKVLMTIIFFVLVVPIGLIRKLFGKDNLKINQFKKGSQSEMENRNHLYKESDITNTF